MRKIAIILLVLMLLSSLSFSQTKTIRIWAMGEEAKNLSVMTDKFTKETGIKVEVQALPWTAAFSKILTGIAGRQLPDMAMMGTTWMAPFAAMGAFEDLGKYISKSNVVKPDKFFSGSWETVVYGGKVYGVPWYVDVRVLYYRTDMLKEVGYEKAPDTWDELYDAIKKLAQKYGLGNCGLGLSPTEAANFMPFVWQNGGDVIDKNKNILVKNPEFVEALDFYARFYRENLVAKGGANVFVDFESGLLPMFFSGPWMVSMIKEQVPKITGKWAVAVMPKKKTRTSFVGGSNWVIFTTSKEKDSAWKFIEFMSKPENQLEWYRVLRNLPAVKETWNSPELANDPFTRVFGEQLKDAKSTPIVPEWDKIESALGRRVEEACLGKRDVKEAVELLYEDLRKVLKK
ncbi:MAG: ABC transporter substrate-binding protein [Dictyoglomus sp. NZ13-RE01]|nr:MAG: ABC transporter substrate-binding protein [Dictyoglomus sp. NZ13-RE01]